MAAPGGSASDRPVHSEPYVTLSQKKRREKEAWGCNGTSGGLARRCVCPAEKVGFLAPGRSITIPLEWPTPIRLPPRRTGCWNWSDAWNERRASPRSSKVLTGGHAATLDGVWGSSCALVAAALAAHAPATLLVVCPQIDQVDELIDDLALFTRLEARAVSGFGIVRPGGPRRGFRPTAALVEVARGRRRGRSSWSPASRASCSRFPAART